MKRSLFLTSTAQIACALVVFATGAFAQNAALMPLPRISFLDGNGAPLSGGYLRTCVAGTACSALHPWSTPSNPLATYTDSSGGTPAANPIVLDSAGSASVWLGAGTYKVVLTDVNGVSIWTQDNVSSTSMKSITATTGAVSNFNVPGTLTAGNINSSGPISGTTISGTTISGTTEALTGGPTTLTLGTAGQALQGGFPTNVPSRILSTETTSAAYMPNPQAFFSRIDSTPYSAIPCTPTGPLAACDAPIVRVSGTNAQTTNIPSMVGVEVDLYGFKANDYASVPFQSNYVVGFGAQVQDAAVDNVTTLRGANLIVDVNGLPTHAGSGGFTRSAFGLEINTNNSSSADGVVGANSAGNNIGGLSINHNGPKSATSGIEITSSAATGKGYRIGEHIAGSTEVGLLVDAGGAGVFSPTYGIAVNTASSIGMVIGSGTVTNPFGHTGIFPTIGMLLDARGTSGVNENKGSNTLGFRAKNADGSTHDFVVQQVSGAGGLAIFYDGVLAVQISGAGTIFANGLSVGGSNGVTATVACTAGQHLTGATIVGGIITAVPGCS